MTSGDYIANTHLAAFTWSWEMALYPAEQSRHAFLILSITKTSCAFSPADQLIRSLRAATQRVRFD